LARSTSSTASEISLTCGFIAIAFSFPCHIVRRASGYPMMDPEEPPTMDERKSLAERFESNRHRLRVVALR
jgi:hypothetical protein